MVFLHAIAFLGNVYTTTTDLRSSRRPRFQLQELVVFLHAIAFLGNIYTTTTDLRASRRPHFRLPTSAWADQRPQALKPCPAWVDQRPQAPRHHEHHPPTFPLLPEAAILILCLHYNMSNTIMLNYYSHWLFIFFLSPPVNK